LDKQNKIKSSIVFFTLVVYYFFVALNFVSRPYSTVIESKEGELLGAKIA
jgi:penicillin-binding protein 1C